MSQVKHDQFPKHGWHPITEEDIYLGVIVRFLGMNDTFNTGVIISLLDDVVVARPYAYASAEYSSNQPLMGCELVRYIKYSISMGRHLEVWHGRDGVRKMAVKAA